MYKAIIFNLLGERFTITTGTLERMIERLCYYKYNWEYFSFALITQFDGFNWSEYITFA